MHANGRIVGRSAAAARGSSYPRSSSSLEISGLARALHDFAAAIIKSPVRDMSAPGAGSIILLLAIFLRTGINRPIGEERERDS